MRMVSFGLYYLKLQLSVLLGFHQTAHPLGMAWRWDNWKYRNQRKRDGK